MSFFRQNLLWIFLGLVIILFFNIWPHLGSSNLQIYQLSIGQGDSALIITPEQQIILIDGGPDGSVINWLNKILPFYQKQIDLVILTHPHADHINGLLPVFENYQVKNLLYTGVKYNYFAYDTLLQKAAIQHTRIILDTGKFDLKLGSVLLDLIYPFHSEQNQTFNNVNNSSIALRLIYGKNKIWFGGDLEKEPERKLINTSLDLSADLMKAGHHGSRTSNTPGFLKRIHPKYAVISCGAHNKFNHPSPETLQNFHNNNITVYRTDIDGTIKEIINGISDPILQIFN